jgi:large subunit ribosomal protein L10
VQKRSEKEQVVAELHEKLAKAKVAIVAQPNKLDVATVTQLRKQFRAQNIEYRVVKNTLAKRAAQGTEAEVLESILEGPTALIVGYDDPVSPAKVLQAFIEKNKKDQMSVRGAVLDGKLLDAKAVEQLAKLPGLDELRAMLAGMINRPAQMLATVISQPGGSIARVVNAHREAQEKQA